MTLTVSGRRPQFFQAIGGQLEDEVLPPAVVQSGRAQLPASGRRGDYSRDVIGVGQDLGRDE
jgi:hypothetical protein